MRYNYKHAMETKDGLSYSVFGAPDLPRFVSELVMEICLNPLIQNRSDSKKIESSLLYLLCLKMILSIGLCWGVFYNVFC